MKTKVKFLFERPEEDYEPQVFAFFPEEIYSKNVEGTFMSYAHVGQHSPCSIEYANECEEACLTDYLDLQRELEGIGYKLEVLNNS